MSVTTANTAPTGGLPRNRVLAGLLAVSVVLNLCVVAGVGWTRFNAPALPPTAAERFAQLANELHLTPEQQVAYDKYVAAMRLRGERLRDDTEPLIAAAWAEIAKPQPDEAQVQQLFDDAATRRHVYQREALAETLALLATLSPDQRAKFVADARERRAAVQRLRANGPH